MIGQHIAKLVINGKQLNLIAHYYASDLFCLERSNIIFSWVLYLFSLEVRGFFLKS